MSEESSEDYPHLESQTARPCRQCYFLTTCPPNQSRDDSLCGGGDNLACPEMPGKVDTQPAGTRAVAPAFLWVTHRPLSPPRGDQRARTLAVTAAGYVGAPLVSTSPQHRTLPSPRGARVAAPGRLSATLLLLGQVRARSSPVRDLPLLHSGLKATAQGVRGGEGPGAGPNPRASPRGTPTGFPGGEDPGAALPTVLMPAPV